MSLESKAILSEFSCSLWEARTLNKQESQRVCNANNATQGTGRVWVTLGSRTLIDKMRSIIGKARHYHYSRTFPFAKGLAILPADFMEEYDRNLKTFAQEFSTLKQDFIAGYRDWTQEAPELLGNLYDASKYPPSDKIAEKFGISWEFSPVPGDDFRCSLTGPEAEAMKKEWQAKMSRTLSATIQDLWSRIITALKKITYICEDQRPVHETLFDDIRDLASKGNSLNVTDDPDLTTIIATLKATVFSIGPKDVKSDRERVLLVIEPILDECYRRSGIAAPIAPAPVSAPVSAPEPDSDEDDDLAALGLL